MKILTDMEYLVGMMMEFLLGMMFFGGLFLIFYTQLLGFRIHRLLDPKVTDKTLFTYSFSVGRFIYIFPIPLPKYWYKRRGFHLDSAVISKIHFRNTLIIVLYFFFYLLKYV